MQTEDSRITAGWSVGRSIALELDVIFTIIGGYFLSGGFPGELMEMIQSLPELIFRFSWAMRAAS
jgi:hypothetical protein